MPAPIRLRGGPEKFTVLNASGGTLRDVMIARLTPEGLRVVWLDELVSSASGQDGGSQVRQSVERLVRRPPARKSSGHAARRFVWRG